MMAIAKRLIQFERKLGFHQGLDYELARFTRTIVDWSDPAADSRAFVESEQSYWSDADLEGRG